jgi:hypothetical protein
MRCQAQRGVPGAGREHWAVRAVCWVAILGLLAIHGPQARADLITSQDWDFNNAP